VLKYSTLYEKRNPALECKNNKRQPTYRKTQVSVVDDMRFRGVASLNQVGGGRTEGHNFGVGNRNVFLAFCATRLSLRAPLYTLAAVCVELFNLYAYMIAAHFHDIPYIRIGAPSVLGGRFLGAPVPTPRMRLCIYRPSTLFRIYRRTACFSVIS